MHWFTKARVSSKMIIDTAFRPGIVLSAYRFFTEPELSFSEIVNTALAAAGFTYIMQVLLKVVKKLSDGAPEEPDSREDVGDIDALLATLSGIAIASMNPHSRMVDSVLDIGSTAVTYLCLKGYLTGTPAMFNYNDNQPAQVAQLRARL